MHGPQAGRPAMVERDAEEMRDLARQAAEHAARGERPEALRCYEMALLVDETQAQVWFDYGSLQLQMDLAEDAVESFEFALRQDPRLYAARFCLAQLLASMGRPLLALSHFALVTVDKPGHLPAWRNLIELQRSLGDVASAVDSTRRALQHVPGDGELATLLAELERELSSP